MIWCLLSNIRYSSKFDLLLVHVDNIFTGFLLLYLFVGHRLFGNELSVGWVWVEHTSSSVVDALDAGLTLENLAVLALAASRGMTLHERVLLLNGVHGVTFNLSHYIKSILSVVPATTKVLVLELS